jgi:tetratricopeptide (TPR) repeat protein
VGIALLTAAACGGGAEQQKPTLRALPPANPKAVQKYLQATELMASEREEDGVRAAALLREALTIDELLWEAHYNLGVLHRRRGELRKAVRQLQAAHDTQPGAGEPILALAEVYDKLGDPDRAAELLEQYLKLYPDAHATRAAFISVLRRMGKYDTALLQAREVLVRDAKQTGALLEVGRIYRERGELDAAELVFNRALTLGPKEPAPHNELGLTALARGDTQLAFQHFERALEVDRTFAPGRLNRASVLLRAGDYDGAAAEYRRVLSENETHADARVGLAIALRGLGKHAEAKLEYERVLARAPNHAAALFDLGVLSADFLDQRSQARQYFERFLDVGAEGDARAAAERYLRDLPEEAEAAPPPPAKDTPAGKSR